MAKRQGTTDRFWAKVAKVGDDECWIWTGCCQIGGYGQFLGEGRQVGAHRYSWEYHVGPIPKGLCVLHRCDNPKCVNPGHLFLGTNAENTADMYAKGRANPVKGQSHGGARATEDVVREVRHLSAEGWTYASLSHKFGLGEVTIFDIVKRKTWKHVE